MPNGQFARYRTLYIPGHSLARKTGNVQEHRVVLYARIGPGEHRCHWCNCLIRWTVGVPASKTTLVVDHLNDMPGDNRDENLVPSCVPCNGNRGRRDLISNHEIFLITKAGTRRRAMWLPCAGCNRQFLSPLTCKGIPCQSTCSLRCAGIARSGENNWRVQNPNFIAKSMVNPETELFVWNGKWRQRALAFTCAQCHNSFVARSSSAVKRFCKKACEVAYRKNLAIERKQKESVAA